MDLTRFFTPRGVAIIGASLDVTTINGKPLYYLEKHGYRGNLYPVNPKYARIGEHRCYPSAAAIDGPVDLALIAVNFRLVPTVLADCAAKRVPFVTIFSSGFAEAGDEGQRIQQQIAEMARESGIRLCGPNCQGAVDLIHGTAAAFSAALDRTPLKKGDFGFVTQSGAMGYSIFSLLQEKGVGCAYVASTGNEVDLNCLDFMEFMVASDDTRVVFAYMEGIHDGRRLGRIAEEARRRAKPLAVFKVGRSEAGSRAAQSHTASLTGSSAVFDAFVRQNNVIAVQDIQELVDLGQVIQAAPAWPRGVGLGVVSTSGGGGVICADAAEACGLTMAELAPETLARIEREIPAFGSAVNPVDVTAQTINTAGGFAAVLDAVEADPGVDAIVVVVTNIVGQPGKELARCIVRLGARTRKPVAVGWTAAESQMGAQFAILREARVPLYVSPLRAVRALAHLMHYGRGLACAPPPVTARRESSDAIRNDALLAGNGPLGEDASKRLLARWGIDTGRSALVQTAAEACRAAVELGYPLAAKVDSADIPHKTEAGAVRLNVSGDAELRRAVEEITASARRHHPEARIDGVHLQAMITGGVETIAGISHDPQFGPTVMFGLGGIYVETLRDVVVRIAPVTRAEALDMIAGIRGHGILEGARGRPPADVHALADTLVNLSRLAMALEDRVREVDINPLIVLPKGQGVRAADALVVLKKENEH